MADTEIIEAPFAEQIRQLPPGQTIARVLRIPFGSKEIKDVKAGLGRLRNGVNQVVSRIRKKTGQAYRVESGTMLTDDQEAVIATVCVTRDEDDGIDI